MPRPAVCVTIVTYNSRRYIRRCLRTVLRQKGVPLEVVVVDNASTDGTPRILAEFGDQVRVIHNDVNRGFAQGQNQAIAASQSGWVLTLNPDALLLPDFIRRLVEAGELDATVGAVCGRLLAIGAGFKRLAEPCLDSTGICFTPAMRHFDRGWHEPDGRNYGSMEYVFGASAAAALYRREMIAAISVNGEFFDPDFFAYREDADVAWRAQLLGWRCLYTPMARAYHVRAVTPGSRRSVPAVINMHSVKNRFLLRIKNATGGLYRRFWLPATMRDLLVLGACLFYEPSSLPALWRLGTCLGRALERRRWIMSRRAASDEELARWFAGAARPEGTLAGPLPRVPSGQAAAADR